MSTDLFTFVGLFDNQLQTARHLLDKGGAAGGEAILGWRLADDMHPLAFQLGNVIRHATEWPARVAGVEPPAPAADGLDIPGYRAALATAHAFLTGLTPTEFAGRDEVAMTEAIGPGISPTLPAGRWVSGFATTSLYFHVAMLYAILRRHGVAIGKRDLFAGGL